MPLISPTILRRRDRKLRCVRVERGGKISRTRVVDTMQKLITCSDDIMCCAFSTRVDCAWLSTCHVVIWQRDPVSWPVIFVIDHPYGSGPTQMTQTIARNVNQYSAHFSFSCLHRSPLKKSCVDWLAVFCRRIETTSSCHVDWLILFLEGLFPCLLHEPYFNLLSCLVQETFYFTHDSFELLMLIFF